MYKKKHPSGYFSGILFLLVFFFSLSLFSAKLAPEQKTDDTPEISVTALLQTDAVQPQPAVSFDPASVTPSDLLFSPVPSVKAEVVSFTNRYVYEGPDPFRRFFYFHHSAYGNEPHRVA